MFKRLSISVSLVTLFLTTANTYAATSQNISGVVRVSSGSSGTGLSATYFTKDPATNADPGYAMTVTSAGVSNGYVGINVPTLHQGLLPNFGTLQEIIVYYLVPNGFAGAAGALRAIVQTSDGYYHVSTSYNERGPLDSGNALYSLYICSWFPASFSPPVSPETAQMSKAALVFYGNSSCLQIAPYQDYFAIYTGSSYIYLSSVPGYDQLLTSLAPTDSNFNFELNSGNN